MPTNTKSLKPQTRSLLKEKAYREIKQRIQRGDWAGGQFLSERQLAHWLDMSKTPIKAALERLELEGFVSVSPQQGIVVRELSIQEVADQFELRQALECYVVRALAGKLSAPKHAPIIKNLTEQSRAAKQQNVARLVELDAQFHLLLCEAFGNAAILDCMAQHRAKMHRVIYQVMSQAPNRLAEAVREHREIHSAIKHGDADLAVERVVKHLNFGKHHLLTSQWS